MISLRLKDKDTYALRIIGGPRWKTDKRRVSDLPERYGVWKEVDGEDTFDHYEVPRVDVGEILRRWTEDEIEATEKVEKDFRLFRWLKKPLLDHSRIPKNQVNPARELYPHQSKFVRCAPKRIRIGNTFPTGKGKTTAAIERAKALGHKTILVISLGAIIEDWQAEVRDTLSVELLPYQGTPTQRREMRKQIRREKPQVVWCTYDLAPELAKAFIFDHVVFDEAHIICNSETKKSKRLFETIIAKTWEKMTGVTVLTATPMGNLPIEMWNLIRIIHPFLAGSKRAFELRYQRVDEWTTGKSRFKTPDGQFRWGEVKRAKSTAIQNTTQLNEILNCTVIQYEEDSQEEPQYEDKIKVVEVAMTDEQEVVYNDLHDKLQAVIGRRHLKIKDARSKFTRLLQTGEGLYNLDLEQYRESGKLRHIYRILKRAKKTGEKIIIWSPYKAGLELLHEMFKDCSVIYTGDLNKSQKRLSKWSFNGVKQNEQREDFARLKARYDWPFEPGEAQFFFGIIAPQSSVGMNLDACGRQIFMSFSLSGYAMTQTRGRILRKSTKHKVLVTEYLVSNDLERKWLQYVLRKYENSMRIMKGGKGETLSRDTVIRLGRMMRRCA